MNLDSLLLRTGPAALVLRHDLEPVEGPDGVFFPATFAASEDGKAFAGGYNIDDLGNGKNVCLVDSVGSQANRIEPLFMSAPYDALVPQVVVKAGAKKINLLEAGHRAGDAIVRCSSLQESFKKAFDGLLSGNGESLAKLAPTSLVFGVWDSRDTQAKAPRIISSVVRAFDVKPLTRSAVYLPATNYFAEGLLEEPEDKKLADLYSSRGFKHAPASRTHGGVVASGGVRREATLHLAALRTIRGPSADRSAAMGKYLLGLALTAFTSPVVGYLRQGCNLVPANGRKAEIQMVGQDGVRAQFALSHDEALEFAQAAAKAFGVGESREVEFDAERVKVELAENADKKSKKSGKKK